MMRPERREHRERGVVMVLAAFLLMVMGAFLALSLNAGHGVAVRGELQNATDSAALAGVRELNGTLAAVDPARGFADNFAKRHVTDPTIGVAPKLIEFGNWDPAAPRATAWTRLDPTVENLYRLNAIRVVAAREAGAPGGGALTAFFGQAFLDRDKFDVNAEAIAYAGAPCPGDSGCNSPFVIRYGCLVRGDLRCDADYVIGLSSAGVDSAGLSDMMPEPVIPGNPSANTNDMCDNIADTTSSVTCTIGQSQLRTSNGTPLKASCGGPPPHLSVCQRIQARYPVNSTMRVPVVIYEGDHDVTACMDGQYGGVATVISTIEMRIDGVYCDGEAGEGLCAAYATGNCIRLHTLCDDTNDQPGACVALGTVTQTAKLGR